MDTTGRLREGWPSLLLVWAMLLITSVAVLQADLTDGLHVLPLVATVALAAGWLLAKSVFSDRTAHIFALIYGLFFITYFVGITLPFEGPWRERVLELIGRQVEWLQKAVSGGTSRDGIIFVIQTTAVFWILGYLGGWYTFRRAHVWRVVVPIGIVLLSVVYYYNGPRPLLIYLALYTLLALIFVAITHLTAEESRWRQDAVRFDRGIRFDFMRAGLVAALLALLLAWSMPGLKANAAVTGAFSGAGGPWRSFQDTWTRLFSSLRSYGAGTSDPYQDTLVLGGPRTVGNTLVMDVQVAKELPFGVYWQAIVYDTYTDGSWRAVENDSEPVLHYPDDGPLDVPFTMSREVITQTVTNYLPNSSFLYAAPEVVSSDKQMLVDATYDPQGKALITSLRSRFILRQGDQYQVASRVSVADATSLRNASTEYPQWVLDRYLQLPETITPETLALAEDITSGQANPYDKAIVVRNYLRNNINYNDQIQAAPDGVDPVHYTLFNLGEAYCTYYASAMAVMLRSQGVPTRVVSGYALGEYDEATLSYRVRAVNAHTWVEVYFPDYGWIHFEPTQTIPVAERPTSGSGDLSSVVNEALAPDPQSLLPPEELNDVERADGLLTEGLTGESAGGLFGLVWWQAAIGAILLVLAGVTLYAGAKYNSRVEGDVDRSFTRLGDWSRWLGIPWRATQTPYEQADSLVAIVPEGQKPVRSLTRQYVLRQFSPAKSIEDDFDPRLEWRQLRPLLIKKRIVQSLNRRRQVR
jgi:transglutaminase-like putative cysteine protease